MTETQTRTLDLGEGRRTTVRFDAATWQAIELAAARQEVRWTKWVRQVMSANPGAENMHAVIRAAAIESLLEESIVSDRAGQLASGRGPVLLEGCTMLPDEQLEQELAAGHVEGDPLELVGFQLLAGLDQHGQPTIWVRNGLRSGMHAAITLAFTAAEVEAKRGAFA